MAQYNRWEIWEAEVPFEDMAQTKRRPVLILSEDTAFVLSFKMTSHPARYKTLDGEYEIMRWEEAGLKKPTVVQCSKLLKLAKGAVTNRQYGKLTSTDIIGLMSMIRYMGYALTE